MEAVFFLSAPEDAVGVSCVDDLPGDPAAEPLALDSPGALSHLVEALVGESSGALRPVRDATCRSFPVWGFSSGVARALSELDAGALELLSERWHARAAGELAGASPYELSQSLGEIRDALREHPSGARLFVLLEEKAW